MQPLSKLVFFTLFFFSNLNAAYATDEKLKNAFEGKRIIVSWNTVQQKQYGKNAEVTALADKATVAIVKALKEHSFTIIDEAKSKEVYFRNAPEEWDTKTRNDYFQDNLTDYLLSFNFEPPEKERDSDSPYSNYIFRSTVVVSVISNQGNDVAKQSASSHRMADFDSSEPTIERMKQSAVQRASYESTLSLLESLYNARKIKKTPDSIIVTFADITYDEFDRALDLLEREGIAYKEIPSSREGFFSLSISSEGEPSSGRFLRKLFNKNGLLLSQLPTSNPRQINFGPLAAVFSQEKRNSSVKNHDNEDSRITATGYAEASRVGARNIAIHDAMRAAIEQGVGTLIDSSSLTENYQLISDKIYSTAKGYVRDYAVLSETRNGEVLEVTIEASVDKESIMDDMNALNIFQQHFFNNKRVLVLYWDEENKETLSPAVRNNVESVRAAIQDFLAQKNFRIFDLEEIMRLEEQLRSYPVGNSDSVLLESARGIGADIILRYELFASIEAGDPYSAALTILRSKVYDVSTGQIIARGEKTGEYSIPSNYDATALERGYYIAGKHAVDREMPELVEKIIKRSSQTPGSGSAVSSYELNFKGFAAEETETILDVVEQQYSDNFRLISRNQTVLRLEVFTSPGSALTLQRSLQKLLSKEKVAMKLVSAMGNSINWAPLE